MRVFYRFRIRSRRGRSVFSFARVVLGFFCLSQAAILNAQLLIDLEFDSQTLPQGLTYGLMDAKGTWSDVAFEAGPDAIVLKPGMAVTVDDSTHADAVGDSKILRLETRFKVTSLASPNGGVAEKFIFDLTGPSKSTNGAALTNRAGLGLRVSKNSKDRVNLQFVTRDEDSDKNTKDHKRHTNIAEDLSMHEWISVSLVFDFTEESPLLTTVVKPGIEKPEIVQHRLVAVNRWEDLGLTYAQGNTRVMLGWPAHGQGKIKRGENAEIEIDYFRMWDSLPDMPAVDDPPVIALIADLEALTAHYTSAKSSSELEASADGVLGYLGKYTSFHYLDLASVKTAIDNFMETFETNEPPLFSSKRRNKVYIGEMSPLDRTLLLLQHDIIGRHFNDTQVTSVADLAFESRETFPGVVNGSPSSDIHTVTIDGTYAPYPGVGRTIVARRPTGLYVVAGHQVEVCGSPSEVASLQVYVGAHQAARTNKRINRAPLIATRFSFGSDGCATVANPFGGGLYIGVPHDSTYEGDVELDISGGIVPSAYYDKRTASGNQTDLAEWNSMLAATTAPWVDLESDKQFMTIPRNAARTIDDPAHVLGAWDAMWDQVTIATGRYAQVGSMDRPLAAYVVVDSMGPCTCGGYPTHIGESQALISSRAGSILTEVGEPDWHQRGGVQYILHEMGHGLRAPLIGGESETMPDFFAMVMHTGNGKNIFDAHQYGASVNLSSEDTVVNWMVQKAFTSDKVFDDANFRDLPNSKLAGVMSGKLRKYSSRGTAKYADIYRAFQGWTTLGLVYNEIYNDWNTVNGPNNTVFKLYEAHENSTFRRIGEETFIDAVISSANGGNFHGNNILPLLEFWGSVPTSQQKLDANNLNQSDEIYNLLVEYRNLVPRSKAEFAQYQLRAESIVGTAQKRRYADVLEEWDVPTTTPGGMSFDNYSERILARIDQIFTDYSIAAPVEPTIDLITSQCDQWDVEDADFVGKLCNNSSETLDNVSIKIVAGSQNVYFEDVGQTVAPGQGVGVTYPSLEEAAQANNATMIKFHTAMELNGKRTWCRANNLDPTVAGVTMVDNGGNDRCNITISNDAP